MKNGQSIEDPAIAALKNSPAMGHLNKTDLMEIRDMALVRHYTKGDLIFLEGDAMDFLYLVQEGRVKLFMEASSGKSYTYTIAHCGDTLHGIVLFSGEKCQSSAQAMDAVTLLCVKKESFLEFIHTHPSVLIKIIEILGRQVRNARLRLLDSVSQDARQRVINTLNMLCKKFGTTLYMTNEEISELAGTTTATTIRITGQLKKSQIIQTHRAKIRIIDPERLEKRCTGAISI